MTAERQNVRSESPRRYAGGSGVLSQRRNSAVRSETARGALIRITCVHLSNAVTSPVILVPAWIHLLRTAVEQSGAERSRQSWRGTPSGCQEHLLDETAWQDEAAMRAFMMAMPHRGAMGKLAGWCDEASVVHWTQDTTGLPDWQEAHRRMATEGRRSRVRRPSEAHQDFGSRRPVLSPRRPGGDIAQNLYQLLILHRARKQKSAARSQALR